MSKLPPAWEQVPLASITEEADQRVPSADEQITYIDIGSVDRNSKTIVTPQHLIGADAPSRARKQVRYGDTLVSMTRPNLNAVALVPPALDGQIASTGFDVLRPLEGIEPRWIAYLVRTEAFVEAMSSLVQGALYPAVRSKDVRAYRVPLAPSAEQTRIVDQLDKLLARVQSCNERIDAIPALLKRFRQAVLAAATSGALTEDWRHANSVGMDSWSESSIGELIERIDAGLNVKCVERPPEIGEIGLVKISAVTWGVFDDDESKTLPPGTTLPELAKIRVGDFLISRANTLELVGACVIVEKVDRAVYLSDKVLRLVLSNEIKPWLLFILRSRIGRKQIETLSSGNQLSMRNLSQANLKSIRIPMPKPKERIEIARRVETLLAFADRIEARYMATRTQAQRLTPLLLAKAFRGELMPQDPNDEPASVLLERIAAERAATATQPRRRQPTAGRKPARAPKENAAMTKSRQDDDVQGKPYLAKHLRLLGGTAPAEVLFKASELPVADFYKQLAWEVAQGHLRDGKTVLELADAA